MGVTSVLLKPTRLVTRSGGRSAFLRLGAGVSLLRYWQVSDAVALPDQTFSRERTAADEPMTRERQVGSLIGSSSTNPG
jgi:hypothetical protein